MKERDKYHIYDNWVNLVEMLRTVRYEQSEKPLSR